MERKFYALRSRTPGSSSLQEGREIPNTSVPAALSPSEGPVIPAPPAISTSQTPVTRCDTSFMEQKVYPAGNHNTDPSSLQTGMQRRISTVETLIRIELDKEEEPITLRMQNQFETAMQSYRTGRTVELEVVFQDYCELKGFVYEHVRFLFDGKRVNGNDTAEKFEMDDDDIIHVMSDQIAGGGAPLL